MENIENKTWAGGGELTVGGFIEWAADCLIGLTDLSSGVKAVNFSATGTGFMIGAIESELVGAFNVDPSTFGKKCYFTICLKINTPFLGFILFFIHIIVL